MARRNDHSREELRAMALDAAERILDDAGVQGLSMRRIAQSIGYTHGTLYLIFENLDGLLQALNERTLEALVEALSAGAGSAQPGRNRALALARAYLAFASANTARWRLIFEHHAAADAPVSDSQAAKISRGFELVARALKRNGEHTVDANLSTSFWAAIHGITVLALDRKLIGSAGEDLDPDALIERTVDVYLGRTQAS